MRFWKSIVICIMIASLIIPTLSVHAAKGSWSYPEQLKITQVMQITDRLKAAQNKKKQTAAFTKGMNIPILMYHSIDSCKYTSCVSEKNFKRQINALAAQKLTFLTMEQVLQHVQSNKPFPARAIVLTFDDGYLDNYTVAKPIMDEHQITATLFMVIKNTKRKNRLHWEHLLEMHQSGWDIQSHTYTHADLWKEQDLDFELGESKAQIEMNLNKKADIFCYPYGKFTEPVITKLKSLGYKMAVSTRDGVANTNESLFKMRRIVVMNSTTIEEIMRKSGIPMVKVQKTKKKDAHSSQHHGKKNPHHQQSEQALDLENPASTANPVSTPVPTQIATPLSTPVPAQTATPLTTATPLSTEQNNTSNLSQKDNVALDQSNENLLE